MIEARTSDGGNWTHGRAGAPIGSQEWADHIRLKLVAMVEHLGEDDEGFVRYIELLQEHRAWSLLTKKDGSTFRTREEFCSYKRPWGLGISWDRLRPYVVAGLAKRGMAPEAIDRALALDGVPEPTPTEEACARAREARSQNTGDSLSHHNDGIENIREKGARVPTATVERLRAINRAPDAIREAYKEGRISQTLAAKLGPKDPDPETAATIAEIAAAVRGLPERKAVDEVVRSRLGVPKPIVVRLDADPVKAAQKLREKFGDEWLRALVAEVSA